MHSYGIIIGVASLAAYNSWYAWVPGIIALGYLALFTSLLGTFGVWIEHGIYSNQKERGFVHSFFWSVWLAVYWLLITYGILWPLGRCEGYLLLNPIIPWASHPVLLEALPYLGVAGMTVLFCSLAGLIAYYMHAHATMVALGLLFLALLVYTIDQSESGLPSDVRIAHVPKIVQHTDDTAAACRLVHEYVMIAVREADARYCAAVFPESAFYPWQLCAESLLAHYIPEDGAYIRDYVIGSFYDDNGQYRNSCYWLRDGIVQVRYDKRHAMPLIERMPWWLQHTPLYQLFFARMPAIIPSNNTRPLLQLGDIYVVPYICSELFFNRLPDDQYDGMPIIALVNDRWCTKTYVQELMYLGAVVQAHAWQRAIIYVAYSRWVYIYV